MNHLNVLVTLLKSECEVLPDLGAVFNTADHNFLLQGFQHSVGTGGTALQWFVS